MEKLFKVNYRAYVSVKFKRTKMEFDSSDGYGSRNEEIYTPNTKHSLEIELVECELEKQKAFKILKDYYDAQSTLNTIAGEPINDKVELLKTNVISNNKVFSGKIDITLEDLLSYFPEEDEKRINDIIEGKNVRPGDFVLEREDEYTFLLRNGIKGIYPTQIVSGDVDIFLRVDDKFPKYDFSGLVLKGDAISWGDNTDIWDDIEPYIEKYGDLDARYIP